MVEGPASTLMSAHGQKSQYSMEEWWDGRPPTCAGKKHDYLPPRRHFRTTRAKEEGEGKPWEEEIEEKKNRVKNIYSIGRPCNSTDIACMCGSVINCYSRYSQKNDWPKTEYSEYPRNVDVGDGRVWVGTRMEGARHRDRSGEMLKVRKGER
jgi:hypothetical protein